MSNLIEIQKKEKEILASFQTICKKYGLGYFAIGGTCIGAVRHKGFIPWDDDIDVAMPYEDYRKFLKVAEKELPDNLKIISDKNCRHFLANFFKIHDISTTFIEAGNEAFTDRYCGIFVDVFPVFYLPDNVFLRNMLLYFIEFTNKLSIHARYPDSYFSSRVSKMMHKVLKPVVFGKTFNYYSILQEKILSKYDHKECRYLVFPWRGRPKKGLDFTYKEVFFAADFAETIDVSFDEVTISIPVGYDRYLKMDFGNYMELPPEEKRVGVHANSIVSTKISYIELQKEKENYFKNIRGVEYGG